MQWNSNQTSFGGFCSGTSCNKPWLPLNANYESVNVEMQQDDEKSTLHLYKNLIKLRQEKIVLQKGGVSAEVLGNNDNVFAFKRTLKDHATIAVCINLGAKEIVSLLDLLHPDDVSGRTRATVLLTNNGAEIEIGTVLSDLGAVQLGEHEAVVFEVSSAITIFRNTTLLLMVIIVIFNLL